MEFRSHGFRLIAGFALAIATSSAMYAQVPCLGSPERIYSGTFQGFLFVDDQDLDGDVDVGYGGGIVKRFENDGSGLFTYVTPDIFSLPASGGGNSFSFSNLDADSLPDLTFVDSTAQQLIVVLHSSFGTIGAGTAYATQSGPNGVAVGDIDGDGDKDIIVTSSTSSSFAPFWNNGSGSFAPTGPLLSYSTAAGPIQPRLADFNGDGTLDLALLHVGVQQISIFPGNGNGTFGFPVTLPTGPDVTALTSGDLNGDGRVDLVISYGFHCGGAGCVPEFRVRLQQPGGVFSPPAPFALGCQGLTIELGDVDSDGDLDALAPGVCGPAFYVALGNGDGTFGPPATLLTPDLPAARIRVADVDGDGDNDVITTISLVVSSINENRVEVYRSCLRAGTPYCAGDGSASACPCGNTSTPGAKLGCSSSLGVGGSLRGSGTAQISNDTVSLFGSQMPSTSTVLYFQGSAKTNGGNGNAFGDGLQCAGATIVRLAVRLNSGGASTYPTGADPSLHVQGGVTVPGERYYQAWYRDNANFCTPAGFNLTNALALRWAP